jgi:hypothetical protein
MKKADAESLLDTLDNIEIGDWYVNLRSKQTDEYIYYYIHLVDRSKRHPAIVPQLKPKAIAELIPYDINPLYRIVNPDEDVVDKYAYAPYDPDPYEPYYEIILDNHEKVHTPSRAEELRQRRLDGDLRDALDLPDDDYHKPAAAYTTVAEVLTATDLEDHVSQDTIAAIHSKRSPALNDALENDTLPRLIIQNEHGTYDPAYDLHSTPDIEADLQHKAELDNTHL